MTISPCCRQLQLHQGKATGPGTCALCGPGPCTLTEVVMQDPSAHNACWRELLNQGVRPLPECCGICGLGACVFIQRSPPPPPDRAIIQRTELVLHETDPLEAMLSRVLPPGPDQIGTLIVSKSRERSYSAWMLARAAIEADTVIEARHKMAWSGGRSATFGSADGDDKQGRRGVHRYAGFWCEVLCIDRVSDFTDADIGYLIAMTQRPTGRFRPRVLATR